MIFGFDFTDMEYKKLEHKVCSPLHGRFESVETAMDMCNHDVQCKGVYDSGCNDSLNHVSLCYVGFNYSDSSFGNCVYDKKGIQNVLLWNTKTFKMRIS